MSRGYHTARSSPTHMTSQLAAASQRVFRHALLQATTAWRGACGHRWLASASASASALPPSLSSSSSSSSSSPSAAAASGAAPEATAAQAPELLPFGVLRTRHNHIPVYSDIRNGRTRVLTIVRHVQGDAMALKKRLEDILGPKYPVHIKTGRLEIKGLHTKMVKEYLISLGF